MGSKKKKIVVVEEPKNEWVSVDDTTVVAPPIESLVEERVVVVATESPESVMKTLMSEEHKRELVERLKVLKETLDQLEVQNISRDIKPREEGERKVLTLDEIMTRATVLQNVNAELRLNIYTFSQSDRHDLFSSALEVLGKTTAVYKEIVEQLK